MEFLQTLKLAADLFGALPVAARSIWPLSNSAITAHPSTHAALAASNFLAFSIAAKPPQAVPQILQQQGLALHLLQQVHGSNFADTAAMLGPTSTNLPQADAWLWLRSSASRNVGHSKQPNQAKQAFGIYTADCIPALLRIHCAAQPNHECGALLHLGRRSIETGLLGNCYKALRQRLAQLGPAHQNAERYSQIVTASLSLGPGIGPCCYEVPRQMAADFCRSANVSKACCCEHRLKEKQGSHQMLDLKRAICEQAVSLGLISQNIQVERLCTSCQAGKYLGEETTDICYSYRQGHKTERIYTVVILEIESQRTGGF